MQVWSIGLSMEGNKGKQGEIGKVFFTLINTIFVRVVVRLFYSGSGGNFYGSANF